MADLSKLYEAVPELHDFNEEEVIRIWRDFMNAVENKDLLPLLFSPLSETDLRKIQRRFAARWTYTPLAKALNIEHKLGVVGRARRWLLNL